MSTPPLELALPTHLQFALALGFVLALIGVLTLAARRFGLAAGMPQTRGRPRRLAVIETLSLDPKRRLVLVRRDGTEHLLILGPAGEQVVEAGISAPPSPFPSLLTASPEAAPLTPAGAGAAP